MYFCIMVSLHVHSSGLVSAIENVHGNTIDRILMPNRELGPRTDEACSTVGTHRTENTQKRFSSAFSQSWKFLITLVTFGSIGDTAGHREHKPEMQM